MLKSLVDASNWRIGAKIFAGFGSIIVLLALVSGFGVYELSSTGASVTRLNTASEASQRILELDQNMEVMRQRALRFKALHDKASVDEFNEAYKQSAELLAPASRARRAKSGVSFTRMRRSRSRSRSRNSMIW